MPEITESTPRESYTIAEETFSVPLPYTSGHVLNDNEAATLNQTWAENARNNFARKVKDAKEAGTFDLEVFQGQLDDYLANYEFGVRTGGGRTGDPVMQEAMIIARDAVRKAIRGKGQNLTDYAAKEITDLAKQVIESGKYPEILEKARERVESTKELAGISLDSLMSSDEPKAKKAKAEAA